MTANRNAVAIFFHFFAHAQCLMFIFCDASILVLLNCNHETTYCLHYYVNSGATEYWAVSVDKQLTVTELKIDAVLYEALYSAFIMHYFCF